MKETSTSSGEALLEQPSIGAFESKIKDLVQSGKKNKATKAEIKRWKSELNKLYAANKKRVIKFEETNYDYIALIRSTNGFYKMFGHSALFYTYNIAPKLNLQANLQSDHDFTARSSEGFVPVRQLAKIAEAMRTIKIQKAKTKDRTGDFVVYKLPWTYTDEQLQKLTEQNLAKMQKFNHVVLVDNVVPVLFIQIEELLKAVYENVRGMAGPVERETMGYAAIDAVTKMAYAYLDLANGRINKVDCLKQIKDQLRIAKYQTKLITDLKIWTPRTCARIGEMLIKVQDIIEREAKNI